MVSKGNKQALWARTSGGPQRGLKLDPPGPSGTEDHQACHAGDLSADDTRTDQEIHGGKLKTYIDGVPEDMLATDPTNPSGRGIPQHVRLTHLHWAVDDDIGEPRFENRGIGCWLPRGNKLGPPAWKLSTEVDGSSEQAPYR